jgi:16S rRNA (guanine966-N2)-methyltransferase
MKPGKTASRAPARRHAANKAPHQVRIIGGQWKRTPLPVPDVEGLRPTPDRVRETVFNWLGHLLERDWESVQCLDLFAGSGGLGFEAASRGAARVVLVEAHAGAARLLEATRDKLKASRVEVRRADALAAAQGLASAGHRFDLIFLDPPYHQSWLQRMLPLCRQLLNADGLVYVESEQALDGDEGTDDAAPWLAGWQSIRADRAGMVHYHLLAATPNAADS